MNLSIRNRFVVMSLTLLIGAMAVVAFTMWYERSKREREVTALLSERLDAEWIVNRTRATQRMEAAARELTRDDVLKTALSQRDVSTLDRLLTPFVNRGTAAGMFDEFSLMSTTGESLFPASGGLTAAPEWPLLAESIREKKVIRDVALDAHGDWDILVVYPLFDRRGEVAGAAVFGVLLDSALQAMHDEGAHLAIKTASNELLLTVPQEEISAAEVDVLRAGDLHGVGRLTVDGRVLRYVTRPIVNRNGETVLRLTRLRDVSGAVEKERIESLLEIGAPLALFAAAFVWVYWNVVRVGRVLTEQQAQRIAELTDLNAHIQRAERDASEGRAQLRAIFDSVLDAIVVTDLDGRIEFMNDAGLRMFEFAAPSDIIGKNVAVLMPEAHAVHHGEYLKAFKQEHRDISFGNRVRDLVARRAHGALFQSEVALGVMEFEHGRKLVAVIRDVTERKAAELEVIAYRDHLEDMVATQTADLRVARDQALAAERAMSAFLANMSHELRTPLHGILSFASFGIAKLAKLTPEKTKQYFEEIRDSGTHLLSLVNDLLDLSKMRAGKMIYEMTAESVDDIIGGVLNELGAAASEKNIQFVYAGSNESAPRLMDKTKIGQVVRNILGNALKYSPPGTTVTIDVQVDADDVLVVSVSDQGKGVPPDELESIFEAFEQSSRTRTHAGGTGLGLSICREIIEKGHGGKIFAVNRPEGGACFTFTLPNQPSSAQP